MIDVIDRAHRFFKSVMPDALADQYVRKATEEFQEFKDEPCGEEAADVIICLLGWCMVSGIDLFDEVDRKLAINENRRWKQLPDGTFKHIKESA